MDEEMKFQTGAKLHPPLLQSIFIVAMHIVPKALSRIFKSSDNIDHGCWWNSIIVIIDLIEFWILIESFNGCTLHTFEDEF